MGFTKMKMDPRIMSAIKDMKFEMPTEIQEKAIPPGIEGKDLIGQSMTGSGKTLAFAIPIIQHTEPGKGIQALILAPTRELANQTFEAFRKLTKYKRLSVCEIYGGVAIGPQFDNLMRADIVVGTPGRILDHMDRHSIDLRHVKTLVLDEADRMLDMGFIDDIKMILEALPKKRQTMLFSATMPEEILYIARRYMVSPIKISTQRYIAKHLLKQYYYDIRSEYKISLLINLIKDENPPLALVFCSTRTTTDVVARELENHGVDARAIHGGLTQSRRMDVLQGFHRGQPHILVATDVAARGLDIKNVTHVFNFDIPKTVDEYTHRIGRTARIGKEGKAVSFLCKNDHEAFRKIVGRFDIEKGDIKYKLDAIPLRSFDDRRGGSRRPQRRGGSGGFGRRRRY